MSLYLIHWGTLGMKWGKRRYQNPDGSWTEAGKKRRRMSVKSELKNMSDEELTRRLNRARMEDQYMEIYKKQHPDKLKRIKKIAADIAEKAVVSYTSKWIETKVSEAFKEPEKKTRIKDVDPTKLSDKALTAYNNRRRLRKKLLEKTSIPTSSMLILIL